MTTVRIREVSPDATTTGVSKASKLVSTADFLSSKTHFTSEECKSLLVMFDKMAPTGKFDRIGLRDFMTGSFDITDDIMLDFIFRSFDGNSKSGVDETKFILGLSQILRGSIDEQIDFCYNCYDVNGDGSIVREKLHHCLRGCIQPGYGIDLEDIEDAEKDIVDILMKKLDVNGDGVITKDDFNIAVHTNALLLQGIGPCLPDSNAMAAFMSTFTENYRGTAAVWNSPTISKKSSKSYDARASMKIDDAERLEEEKIARLQHQNFFGKSSYSPSAASQRNFDMIKPKN